MAVFKLGKETALIHIDLAGPGVRFFDAAELALINRVPLVLGHNRSMIGEHHGGNQDARVAIFPEPANRFVSELLAGALLGSVVGGLKTSGRTSNDDGVRPKTLEDIRHGSIEAGQ